MSVKGVMLVWILQAGSVVLSRSERVVERVVLCSGFTFGLTRSGVLGLSSFLLYFWVWSMCAKCGNVSIVKDVLMRLYSP